MPERSARLKVVVFVARVAIGALLIVAGALKAHDGAAATASSIAAYRLLPPAVIGPLGVALPYLELLLGGYLVVGLMTRIAAWIACAQFAVFAAAVASLVVRRLPADCGCFGSSVPTPPSWGHVAFDVGLALVAAGVARYGPGILAFDARLGASGALREGREVAST